MVCYQIKPKVIEFPCIPHIVPLNNVLEKDAFKQGCDVALRVNLLKQNFRVSSCVHILVQQVKEGALTLLHIKGLIYDKIPRIQKFGKRKGQYLELLMAAGQVGGKLPAQ